MIKAGKNWTMAMTVTHQEETKILAATSKTAVMAKTSGKGRSSRRTRSRGATKEAASTLHKRR